MYTFMYMYLVCVCVCVWLIGRGKNTSRARWERDRQGGGRSMWHNLSITSQPPFYFCFPLGLRIEISIQERHAEKLPVDAFTFLYFFFFNLTYSRWTALLLSCLWSLRIFPSLPSSRLTIFLSRCKFSTLATRQPMVESTYSRSHAFRCERKNTNPTLVRIELTTSALAGVQVTY